MKYYRNIGYTKKWVKASSKQTSTTQRNGFGRQSIFAELDASGKRGIKVLDCLKEIRVQRWRSEVQPLVSICCATYNHENYIRDAFEGFLMQMTTFPVEIIVNDDASSDDTRIIIKEYQKKYPELINVIFHQENQYSNGIDAEVYLFADARGKYIALCEGDDYWTDPLKLQKQIQFLENHAAFSVCVGGYTRLNVMDGAEEQSIEKRNSDFYLRGFEFGLQEMQQLWLTKTLTAVFRTSVLDEIDLSVYNHRRDIHLFYHLVKNHKAFYASEDYGVYRVHPGGISSINKGQGNRNIARNCYYELYLNNKDEFTRVMSLKSTLGLLNFNLYNSYKDNNLFKNLRILVDAVFLIRRVAEIKMLFMVFFKREWKDRLKQMIGMQ